MTATEIALSAVLKGRIMVIFAVKYMRVGEEAA